MNSANRGCSHSRSRVYSRLYLFYLWLTLESISIFRTIEFGTGTGGQTGYLLTHEVFCASFPSLKKLTEF